MSCIKSVAYAYHSFRKDKTEPKVFFFLHGIFLQTFNIADPFGPGTGTDRTGAAALSNLAGGATGQCTTDTFQVTGSEGASPVICGFNDGQHSEFTEYIYVQLFSAERSQPQSKYPVLQYGTLM